jgi:hypothetical protein
MGADCGGYLQRRVAVRPGKLVMNPFCKAMDNVDSTGENNAAWANATSSAGVAEPTVARAV